MAQDVPELPPGWLHRPGGSPADDLDLAVLLVNSYDLLDDPPDRLTTIDWYVDALRAAGHPGLAKRLRPADLTPLRELRDRLAEVFVASSVDDAAEVLNPLLVAAGAVPVLVPGADDRTELRVAPDATGLAALQARLPSAVAAQVAAHGLRRMGTCAAGPCRCAYVDRTRSGNRRYCCDLCNDRAAAAAYRRRGAAARG